VSQMKRRMAAMHFLRFTAPFVIGIYSVSSLMPLLLHATLRGLSFADGILIIGYLLVAFLSICILARMIYTLDKKAGRIRNRVGWFE